MWNRNKDKPNAIGLYIPHGKHQSGELAVEGDVRIDGNFTGKLHTEGTVYIGNKAYFQGTIEAGKVEIGGRFKGNMLARAELHILATGRLEGAVEAKIAQVDKGGQIIGETRILGSGS
jgi:cytoskeletal protein CcmA (bactofilin family)